MTIAYIARNIVFHALELHYHYVREHIIVGDIKLHHMGTNQQTVDIFTKALGVDKLRQFASDLGLTPPTLTSLRGSTQSTH